MSKTLKTLILTFFLFFVWGFHCFAADTLWVTSSNAKLKKDKTASSETITILDPGEELEVLLTSGKWYKVSTSIGKTGWIYRGKVSDFSPEEGEEEDELLDELLVSSVDADEADTSRSMRGKKNQTAKKGKDPGQESVLLPMVMQYMKTHKIPDEYRIALEKIITTKVENKAVDTFLKNGKIGEYAK